MFVVSVKDFIDKYYLIHPESERAYNSILRLVSDTDEDGQVKTRLTSMFSFRWWMAHFLTNPRDYSFEDEDLDD